MIDIDAFLDGPGVTAQPESQIDSFLGKEEQGPMSQGVVSEQGPLRDVDREQRPVPGRSPGTGGPGIQLKPE